MQEKVFHLPLIFSCRRCKANLKLTSLNTTSIQQECISLKSVSLSPLIGKRKGIDDLREIDKNEENDLIYLKKLLYYKAQIRSQHPQ